jgi:TatD DNase family protein
LKLFDSHLHLTDTSFAEDLPDVLKRASQVGVKGLVTIASNPDDAERAIDLSRVETRVWCSAGLHPHEAEAFDEGVLARIEQLAAAPEVVAVGETGLDFFYDNSPREPQLRSFEAQLDLAARLDLPAVVHSREADAETAALIKRFRDTAGGVLHCFTGGDGLLEVALDSGWHVSFSGLVTFKKFDAPDRVRRVPDDRLLIETDSPYLAPVPKRGRRNEPAYVAHTCAAVAAIRGVTPEAIAELTTANAAAFYGLVL